MSERQEARIPSPTATDDISFDAAVQITDREFRSIADLVYERFGINLTDKKRALVRGRLNSLMKSLGLSSFEDYYKGVIADTTGSSLLSLIDRISTNHSYFFREAEHYDFLAKSALPEICQRLKADGSNELRIWSAGCAAGEEAYTVVMVLLEFFGPQLFNWNPRVLATDISTTALSQAQEGVYTSDRIKLLPAQYRRQYFKKLSADSYAVADKVKRMILFRRLNLMRDAFPFKRKFHMVFCRNVMIYFDRETRAGLIEKFYRYMHNDGYLLVGHSESLGRDTETFRYMRPTVYRRC